MFDRATVLSVLAVISLAATSASAQAITVENPGEGEATSANTLGLGAHVTGIGFITSLRCDGHGTGTVSSSGHLSADTIDIDPASGSVGNCEGADDCDNAGWEGQINEAGAEYEVNQHFCLSGQGGGLDGVPVEIDCPIFNTEVHCDAPARFEGTSTPVTSSGFQVEVVGEISISNSLDLMH
jgi:hypothetical protein